MDADGFRAAAEREATALGLAAQDPEAAAGILQSVLAEHPYRLSALRPLARLLMRQSRFEEARAHWEQIAKLVPSDNESRMALGRIHARAGRPLEALDRLGEVLRRNPGHAEAQRLRSRIAHKEIESLSSRIGSRTSGEFEPAIAALEERLAGDPHLQRLKIYRASLLDGQAELHSGFPAAGQESTELAFEDPFESETIEFLDQLAALGDAPSLDQLDEIERAGSRIAAENPRIAKTMAQFHADRGNTAAAISAFRRLLAESDIGDLWIEAARFAVAWEQKDVVLEFCTRAARAADADKTVIAAAQKLLCETKAHDAAITLLRGLAGYRSDLDIRRRIVRIQFDLNRDAELADEVLGALTGQAPFGSLPEDQLGALVEILRLLRKSAWRARSAERIAPHIAAAKDRDDGSAISGWVQGVLASAQLDAPAAAGHFEAAGRRPALPRSSRIDFQGETALLYERLHWFGEAHMAAHGVLERAGPGSEYAVPLQRVRKVVEFCGRHENLRYPECLIDVIFEEIASAPIGYAPRERHLLTVTSSLRPGGSERQTVTVVGKMATDPRLERVTLAIRSTDHEDQASFLRAVREMPIEVVHFGENWNRKSDLAAGVPQIARHKRLAAAIDLLPHNLREDIVRLCKEIFERRPQAVHLRQDLFAAAIACAIAGVPRFAVHRGSLSPNLWGHGLLETNLFLRPMRHTYRHLLPRAGFCIVNNSVAGAASDRDWTEWPDPSPFQVVHNAIEFEKLDHEADPGADLRETACIPRRAFVVGGVFRIEAVKRPMLWIETASLVAQACPFAHFVILGDGAMAQQMRDLAQARGFADRLHMPGFVSNVGAWLRVTDLVLLTSDREGLPNVLIEGQHFGVPAVSSDVGGAFETFEAGVTGRLVPADAPAAAFADAILDIIADPAWRGTARARGPAFVHERFGIKRTVDELLALLGIAEVPH